MHELFELFLTVKAPVTIQLRSGGRKRGRFPDIPENRPL